MSEKRMLITQGEQAVSDDPNVVITTLLGSCVSCCLWDPLTQIGGINHMLVTQLSDTRAVANDVGVNAMELLINEILKRGGMRHRLRAKVFGGAQMMEGLPGIGADNAAFTLDFLSQENMECLSHSIGGTQARHLMFWPTTGKVRQRFVRHAEGEDVLPRARAAVPPSSSDLELF